MIETYLSAVIMLYVLACSFIVLSHIDKKRSDVSLNFVPTAPRIWTAAGMGPFRYQTAGGPLSPADLFSLLETLGTHKIIRLH
jgi:hypothetical protein